LSFPSRSPPRFYGEAGPERKTERRGLLRTNIRFSAWGAGWWNDPNRAGVRRRCPNLRIEIGRADHPIGPRQLVARRVGPASCARLLRPVGTRLQALTGRTRLGIRLRRRRRRLRRRSHDSAHQAQKGRKLNASRHDTILQLSWRTTGSGPDAFRSRSAGHLSAGHLSQRPQTRKLAR
jgi:hypothetical protein